MKRTPAWLLCAAVAAVGIGTGCEDQSAPSGPPVFAFVTNNSSDFWKIAAKGVQKAEAEFGVKCEIRMPSSNSTGEQSEIIEALLVRGVVGMAISLIDPVNQKDIVNRACERMFVICHDSDAPDSNRRCYVGTNNVNAGREAGKLVKEVLPNGGKIMLFVGTLDAQNARERRQGLLEAIEGANIEVIGTRTDDTDRQRAKANVESALIANPDLACLVGLWEYNPPAILSALRDAGKAGQIPVVAFDENAATLQGIRDGHIVATVIQAPFEFGYQSVRILKALYDGDTSLIPENKLIEIPVQIVRKDNVDAFEAKLSELMK